MKCKNCKYCRALYGGKKGLTKYECKRAVKTGRGIVYAYMDVNLNDNCHYGGIIEHEKHENTAARAASAGLSQGNEEGEQKASRIGKVS